MLRDRLRRAFVGPAVRVESEHQPIEHETGEVVRIVVAHLQRRQHLPALSVDLLGRERGILREIGGDAQEQLGLVLDDRAAHE